MISLRLLYIFFVFFFLANLSVATAQNILTSTIIWDADEVVDNQVSGTVQYACQFKTNGTSVEWIQKKGEIKTEFKVVAHEGAWPDVSKNGAIIFTLERKEKRSKMIIERIGSEVLLIFDFGNPEEHPVVKKFHIKSIH